jgi:DnaJ-class molecular chaperone
VAEAIVVLAILLIGGGYVLSLKLNPWVKCSKCKNNPKIKGWVYNHAHHVCPKCQGSGQQLRLGRKVLFKRQPVKPSDR